MDPCSDSSSIQTSSSEIREFDAQEQIYQFAPVAIIKLDDSGTLLICNSFAQKLLLKITDQVNDRNLLNLLDDRSRLQVKDYFDKARKLEIDDIVQIEARYEVGDSEYLTYLFKFSPPISGEDGVIQVIATIDDITARKEEEQYIRRYFEDMQVVRDDLEERTSELALLNEKLHQSEIQLEEINKNKDKFFSIISHDLRSPFSSLLGLTKLILEDFDGFSREEIKESLYNLHQVSDGLFNLIEDLLDWSRIQFNRIDFEPKVFNLYEIVSAVIKALKSVARDKNISVVNLVPKNCNVNADPHMIKTIVRNLVNNAIKFTPKYGLIKISSGFDLDDLIISVEDTGVGMTKQVANSLFKMENKVTKSGTEGESGTGLGLLICKEFVEKHNGKIWAKSQLEKGSSFFISIPVEPSKD